MRFLRESRQRNLIKRRAVERGGRWQRKIWCVPVKGGGVVIGVIFITVGFVTIRRTYGRSRWWVVVVFGGDEACAVIIATWVASLVDKGY